MIHFFPCGPVPIRFGWTFTNGRWYKHLNSEFHKKKARHHEHLEGKKSSAASKGGLVSEKSMLELKVDSRAQTSLGAFFGAKIKSQCLSGDSDDSGVYNKSTVDMAATTSSDI